MADLKNKTIITVAPTGAWPKKENNPNVPLTPREIADEVYECWKCGAAVAHLHMRDDEGNGTMNKDKFIETVGYIKEHYPEIMVIADAKRGDIGNTAGRYAKAFFENMPCDAVTLSPYMGRDAIAPFLAYEGKWAVVLGLTSNASAADFELEGGLYKSVISKAMEWGTPDNLMFVAGATRPEMLGGIRSICPDNFLLVPGVGTQGGSVAEVAKYGLNMRCGLLVNSSRGIIYASKGEDFAEAASAAAGSLAAQMRPGLG